MYGQFSGVFIFIFKNLISVDHFLASKYSFRCLGLDMERVSHCVGTGCGRQPQAKRGFRL